jgi:hypothetical protein
MVRLAPGLYFHPNGYVIERERRTWSERTGRSHGQADHPGPSYWWEVWQHKANSPLGLRHHKGGLAAMRHRVGEHESLAKAREWCDEHPRLLWGPEAVARGLALMEAESGND